MDYDLRGAGRQKIFHHFWETFRTLQAHFGSLTALSWLLFKQRDMGRYAFHWARRIRAAFLGQ